MRYYIDAYAWIEYLEGGKEGEKVNSFLTADNEIFIISTTLAEVVSKVKRKKGNVQIAYDAMIKNAKIIEMTPRMAKEAGILHAETRKKIPTFGLADACIVIASRKINAQIITGDPHFKQFSNTLIL